MEHIEVTCSLESQLFFVSLCSIRILNISKVMPKSMFLKNLKISTRNLINRIGGCSGQLLDLFFDNTLESEIGSE